MFTLVVQQRDNILNLYVTEQMTLVGVADKSQCCKEEHFIRFAEALV
jgi:hypothetical protein